MSDSPLPGYSLPGEVSFDNLLAVRAEGEARINGSQTADFDLGALTRASSAVVALLMGWFRYAHTRGKVVRFLHVPPAIMNIIDVSELGDVLPIVRAEGEGADEVDVEESV